MSGRTHQQVGNKERRQKTAINHGSGDMMPLRRNEIAREFHAAQLSRQGSRTK